MTTHRILEQYNAAIKHVNKAAEYSRMSLIGEAQAELAKSSLCVYSALEWAIKNHLLAIFPDSILNATEHRIINGNNFHNKFNLFQTNVAPSFATLNIKPNVISELKQTVRNDVEHSGFVPHYTSLLSVIHEAAKIISHYIDPSATLEQIESGATVELEEDSKWSEFYIACDSFDKNKNYVLVVGPMTTFSPEKLKLLALLDWTLIIDFDPNTENSGFLNSIKDEIENTKRLHLLTSQDSYSFSPYNSLYYLAAAGLEGRSDTITNDLRSWNRKNSSFLQNFFARYFQTFDKPTDIVVLWEENDYVQKICELMDLSSGLKAKWIFAVNDLSKLLSVRTLFDGDAVEIGVPQIADGILRIRNFSSGERQNEFYTLPSKDEEFVSIENRDFLWIEEDFEILHRNILNGSAISSHDLSNKEDFFRGNQISYLGLHFHHDVDREKFMPIKKKIERALKERTHTKFILQHHPGIGGTTLSRRLAWDIRNDNPTLMLRRLRLNESINKVFKVFDLSRKSVLIVADTASTNADDLNKFHEELLGRGFPFVLLIVQRHDGAKTGDFNLEDLLTDIEFSTFIAKYKELKPSKKNELESIERSIEKKERHPFFLGLVAFEENFKGLESFVEKNFLEATQVQKKMLAVIALNYYFGQQESSAQLFSNLVMTPENSVIRLENHLHADLLTLLVNTEDIRWRPIHYLVAKQILIYLLSDNNTVDWKINLADLAIVVIKLIAEKSSIPSDRESELIKRLFVYRDSQEILGKEEESLFSNFIENGLQTDESRLRIFVELTNSFPDESHFWAHLARFQSLKMKNHELALTAIDKAISLSDKSDDSLLYHMKGMCIRALLRDDFNKLRGNKHLTPPTLLLIKNRVDDAGKAFDESRELSPNNDHAYVSDIQMLISTLDFYYGISSYSNKTDFLRNLNPWLQEKLDLAEELLENVKLRTQMRDKNFFVEQCDNGLQEFYENYSQVIESWNNLLSKPDNNKNVIRRSIVRAYVRRATSWNLLPAKEIDKIIKLIEENIHDEPGRGSNILLWFQAARQTNNIDLNTAIDKVSNWRTISEVDESLYYLGVLHTIQAIAGTSISKIKAEKIIRELSENKRNTAYRTHCKEWLGKGNGLKKLIPYSLAVSKDSNAEFQYNSDLLDKITGKISYIKGPEAGNIELSCGLLAYFIPARGNFTRDKDINANVTFYLGFSNDGLRAYDVEFADYI